MAHSINDTINVGRLYHANKVRSQLVIMDQPSSQSLGVMLLNAPNYNNQQNSRKLPITKYNKTANGHIYSNINP